jgi:hypothetical protein
MKVNIGSTDRFIRVVVGVAIIGAGLYFQNWWGAVGIILLITGTVRSCPAYSLININTSEKN